MARYIGKTVTVFTASGGVSGSGFTGVLACIDDRVVKLITRIGAPPACPVGSTCTGLDEFGGVGPVGFGGLGSGFAPGFGRGFGRGIGGAGCGCGGGFDFSAMLGSVTEIPVGAIVSFTHNAI